MLESMLLYRGYVETFLTTLWLMFGYVKAQKTLDYD